MPAGISLIAGARQNQESTARGKVGCKRRRTGISIHVRVGMAGGSIVEGRIPQGGCDDIRARTIGLFGSGSPIVFFDDILRRCIFATQQMEGGVRGGSD